MIICPKCRNQLADGTKFCKFCGQPLSQNPAPSSWEEKAPAQNIQVTPPAPKKKKSSKGIIIAIIAVLLVALIVLGIIFIPDLLDKKKDEEDLTNKEKLTQLLEESTTKPIVEFVYDDYDSDGTYEAYAVVGETDEEDEKHPEFYDADIYFVNQKKAQKIKENISGKSNGKIHLDEITYISIEVYEDGTDEGKSFIYTADGTKSEEADISGEYSNVHEENGKVIGFDENGNEVEIEFTDKKDESSTNASTDDNSEKSEPEVEYNLVKLTQYSSSGDITNWIEYEYDDNGNKIKSTTYNNDGSLANGWYEYKYDNHGNMTKETKYKSDGSLAYVTETEYKYDNNGNIIKDLNYNSDGSLDSWREYEYDNNGNEIKLTAYDSGGMRCWSESEYDENGNITKDVMYGADGSLWNLYEYEYDYNDNMIKMTNYTSYGLRGWNEYEYDNDGNKIKETQNNYDGNMYSMREYEYDVHGNEIKSIYYDSYGTLEFWNECEYAVR